MAYINQKSAEINKGPSAPPMFYEPPPTYAEAIAFPPDGPPAEIIAFNVATDAVAIPKDEAKEILIKYVGRTCCWGSDPARKCDITSTKAFSSFHCQLKTFIEFRSTANIERPYHSEQLTMRGHGTIPKAWDMLCPPFNLFVDQVTKYDVPNTAELRTCYDCNGQCKIIDVQCHGSGRIKCISCNGSGRETVPANSDSQNQNCTSCNGNGHNTCINCQGSGKINCHRCQGSGRLVYQDIMTRTLLTLLNERVVDTVRDPEISHDIVKASTGTVILNVTTSNISPPSEFSLEMDQALIEIKDNSLRRISELSALQHQEQLIIKGVNITKVNAKYKNKSDFHFWVYGVEKRIEIQPDWGYPHQCCCGFCTIV